MKAITDFIKHFQFKEIFWLGIIIILGICGLVGQDIGKEEPAYVVEWDHVIVGFLVLGFMFFLGICAGIEGVAYLIKDKKENKKEKNEDHL